MRRPTDAAAPVLWRAVGGTWRVAVPVVVVAAAAQTALTLPVATPAAAPLFVALLAGSFVVAVLTVWVLAAAAVVAVRERRSRWGALPWRAAPLGWSAAAVGLAAASAVLFGPVGAVIAVGGALLVVASTAQERIPRDRRLVWWALQALAVLALVALVDFGLGFFFAAPVAAFLANVLAGAAATLVLVGAARLPASD